MSALVRYIQSICKLAALKVNYQSWLTCCGHRDGDKNLFQIHRMLSQGFEPQG